MAGQGSARSEMLRIDQALVGVSSLMELFIEPKAAVRCPGLRLQLADSHIKKWNECRTYIASLSVPIFSSSLPLLRASLESDTGIVYVPTDFSPHARPAPTPHRARCLQPNRDHRLFLHHWNPCLFPYPLCHQALCILCSRLALHTQHIPCSAARWSMGRRR